MSYADTAKEIRKTVLNMIYAAQSSHIGSNFSCIDILTVLFDKLDFEKDELIVSKGWAAASVYALNAYHKLIPESDLLTYNKDGSKYIGLIEPIGIFGCKVGSGSMGHGLPMGVGMAMAGKKTVVVMSDGEMDCGTTHESALIAAHHNLNNLTVFVDANGWQAMGATKDVLDIGKIADKWTAWGWSVLTAVSGNDCKVIEHCLWEMDNRDKYIGNTKPHVIIAETIKGKGASVFERDPLLYHYKNITPEVYKEAMAEL